MSFEIIIPLVGAIVELAVAAVAYKIGQKEEVLKWLKLFALGVGLHAISLVAEPASLLLGHFLRAIALYFVFCSLLERVHRKEGKLCATIAATVAYFALGTAYVDLAKPPEGPAYFFAFDLPHALLVIITPLTLAALLYKIYAESRDGTALLFSVGMVIYALGVLTALAALHMGA